MMKNINIAILGASGAVGNEILLCLENLLSKPENNEFNIGEIRLLASKRSAGKKLKFQNKDLVIKECTENSFEDINYAIFSAGSSLSKKFAPHAVKSGAVVIDNSSAFRGDNDVPLVIPEINAKDLKQHNGIIANPNCTTIITLMGIAPLHVEWNIKKIIASSYQSVSGSGAQGILEFETQQKDVVNGKKIASPVHYPTQIINNVIPFIGSITGNGYTDEELKLQNETRKILHSSMIKASATCVRVPVLRSHSIAVSVQFEKTPSILRVKELLAKFNGVEIMDDPENLIFPTPLDTNSKYNCQVGRIRKDLVLENGLSMWVVGDQLLKGAALNAVQIMHKMILM